MNDPTKDPRYWRHWAEVTRIKAANLRITAREQRRLLKVAAEYDRLAERAERRPAATEE